MAENTAALPLVMTDELAKAIKDTLDPASLKQLILAEAERQATAAQDAATTQAAADAAKAAADRPRKRQRPPPTFHERKPSADENLPLPRRANWNLSG